MHQPFFWPSMIHLLLSFCREGILRRGFISQMLQLPLLHLCTALSFPQQLLALYRTRLQSAILVFAELPSLNADCGRLNNAVAGSQHFLLNSDCPVSTSAELVASTGVHIQLVCGDSLQVLQAYKSSEYAGANPPMSPQG